MTRKQVLLIVGVNALISTIISVVVAAVLVSRPEWVSSRLQGSMPADSRAGQAGNPEANSPGASETEVARAAPSPIIHTVESGDTLMALAIRYNVSADDIATANELQNPDAISVGMELVIPVGGLPEPSPTPQPPPTVPSTPTMPFEPPSVQTVQAATSEAALAVRTPLATASQPKIDIAQIIAPGNVEQEAVVIENVGNGVVDLGEWTLNDDGGNVYVFSRLTLWPQGAITLYTRAGQDSAQNLFWGKTKAVWALGETATLMDAEGTTIATYTAGP